jgi:hypothetical protein
MFRIDRPTPAPGCEISRPLMGGWHLSNCHIAALGRQQAIALLASA